MSDKGMGVMLHMLFGDSGESAQAIQDSLGKVISEVYINPALNNGDGMLLITFSDKTQLQIWDDGRSCCESRYMTCDDRLEYFVGETLNKVEVNDGPTANTEYGEPHETQFLIVTTSVGHFTCVTHNEHNGYYGGFWLQARLEQNP